MQSSLCDFGRGMLWRGGGVKLTRSGFIRSLEGHGIKGGGRGQDEHGFDLLEILTQIASWF